MKLILTGTAIILALLLTDMGCSRRGTPFAATVVAKSFIPESTDVGIGTGVASNGKIMTVTTTTHHPQQLVVLCTAGGTTIEVRATGDEFIRAKENLPVSVQASKGCLTGWTYGYYFFFVP